MNSKARFSFFFLLVLLLAAMNVVAQDISIPRGARPTRQGEQNANVQYDRNGRPIPNANRQDTGFTRRDDLKDSITIYYRLFDSTRVLSLDSSINDFSRRYPVPPHYISLGNFGTAARSLLFNPFLKPGFDPGFHAFDIYRLGIEDTRFYQTTRPYTELGYMLGANRSRW